MAVIILGEQKGNTAKPDSNRVCQLRTTWKFSMGNMTLDDDVMTKQFHQPRYDELPEIPFFYFLLFVRSIVFSFGFGFSFTGVNSFGGLELAPSVLQKGDDAYKDGNLKSLLRRVLVSEPVG